MNRFGKISLCLIMLCNPTAHMFGGMPDERTPKEREDKARKEYIELLQCKLTTCTTAQLYAVGQAISKVKNDQNTTNDNQ